MAMPTNGPMEVVFSFDTTGSMSQVLDEVKGRVNDVVQRLQADIPGFKVGIIAHGDYCDAEHFYDIRTLDLSLNVADVVTFVNDTEGTGGGDIPECYELALRHARNMSWAVGSRRVLVVIGDAYPHEADYAMNTQNIDWRDELRLLVQSGVTIYGVQVNDDPDSKRFFETLSLTSGGQYLKLDAFNNICQVIMGICYREHGAEMLSNYEAELRSQHGKTLNQGLETVFGALRKESSKASTVSLHPADNDLSISDDEDDDALGSFRHIRKPTKRNYMRFNSSICEISPKKVLSVASTVSLPPAVNDIGIVDDDDDDTFASFRIIRKPKKRNCMRLYSSILQSSPDKSDQTHSVSDGKEVQQRTQKNVNSSPTAKNRNPKPMKTGKKLQGKIKKEAPKERKKMVKFEISKGKKTSKNHRRSLKKQPGTGHSVSALKTTLSKPKRENTTDSLFKFSYFPWSKWHPAVVFANQGVSGCWKHVAQRSEKALWRRDLLRVCSSSLYKSSPHAHAVVFELGVMPQATSRVIKTTWAHCVCIKPLSKQDPTPHFLTTPWYSGIARYVREPLTEAVKNGAKVYLRWAAVGSLKEARQLKKSYDYAWLTDRHDGVL